MDFFDWFQFISLILFLGIFIGRSVCFKAKNSASFRNEESKPALKLILNFGFLIVALLWIFEIVIQATDVSNSFLPGFFSNKMIDLQLLNIFGVVFIMAALFFLIAGFIAFGKFWQMGLNHQNQGDLITSGILSKSRNPVFVSIILYFVGTTFLHMSCFFSIMAVFCIIGVHFYILKEEKFLSKHYGDKYFEYKKKVRRYF